MPGEVCYCTATLCDSRGAGPPADMKNLPRLEKQDSLSSRADRPHAIYLRAAQAYMLISMPTGTSTIFGVFQVILNLP